MSTKQYLALGNRKKKSKYGNIETIIDGINFSSKLEGSHYKELRIRERIGEITKLALQPIYTLQEGFTDREKRKHRPITYIADFCYEEKGGTVVVECKGVKTDVYKIKKKMFLFRYPDILFIEITK